MRFYFDPRQTEVSKAPGTFLIQEAFTQDYLFYRWNCIFLFLNYDIYSLLGPPTTYHTYG